MIESTPDPWVVLLDAVERVAGIASPTEALCAEVLQSEELAPLIGKFDFRFGSRSGIVVLDLAPDADGQGLAAALSTLGPPIDLDVVSPPVFEPGRPDAGPDWEYKQSHCHLIGGRKVWFGLETTGGIQRLVHVAVHYEESDVGD